MASILTVSYTLYYKGWIIKTIGTAWALKVH